MGKFVPVLVVGIATAIACVMAAPVPKPLDQSPVGHWVSEKIVINGQDITKVGPTFRAEFMVDGRYKMMMAAPNSAPFVGTYTIDRLAVPLSINLRRGPGNRLETTQLGIWKVDGDMLWLCYQTGDGPRPHEFSSPNKSGVMLYKFRRSPAANPSHQTSRKSPDVAPTP